MVRRQIQLTEEQYQQLKRWAASLKISFAEAIRRCVTERLSSEERVPSRKALIREAMKVLGAYADTEGLSNIASEHDRYLTEIVRQ
jgi:hypothetical protein